MAQIVTITNPLTGQPAQVDQLEHTAQEIDDGISRALPGGAIDITLQSKAPAGYGLGETQGKRLYTTDNLNSITTPGWYWWSEMPSNAPISNSCMLVYSAYNGECYVQEIHKYLPSGYTWNDGGTIIIRQIYTTYIGEWEWVNPPMNLGVEYRTTERYLGRPVYVKLVDCGALPNATYKDVQFAGSEARPISVSCTSGATASTATLPTMALGGAFGDGHKIDVSLVNYSQIRIVSDANQSGNICYALVKYWKTTD